MNRAAFLRLSLLGMFALTALDGCGPRWGIIRQAPGNPFGATPIFVAAVDFQGLMIDSRRPIPEAEYLARKTPEQQMSWERDKSELAARIMERFTHEARGYTVAPGTPGPGSFLVAIRVTNIETGSFFRQPQASMTVRIGTPDGQVFDEVNFNIVLTSSGGRYGGDNLTFASVTQKMNRFGNEFGRLLARYTRQRLGY